MVMYYTQYTGADLGRMALDVPGVILNAIVGQAGTLGTLLIIGVVIVLVTDFFTGIFGIFSAMGLKK